jgi:hypothetical protein
LLAPRPRTLFYHLDVWWGAWGGAGAAALLCRWGPSPSAHPAFVVFVSFRLLSALMNINPPRAPPPPLLPSSCSPPPLRRACPPRHAAASNNLPAFHAASTGAPSACSDPSHPTNPPVLPLLLPTTNRSPPAPGPGPLTWHGAPWATATPRPTPAATVAPVGTGGGRALRRPDALVDALPIPNLLRVAVSLASHLPVPLRHWHPVHVGLHQRLWQLQRDALPYSIPIGHNVPLRPPAAAEHTRRLHPLPPGHAVSPGERGPAAVPFG